MQKRTPFNRRLPADLLEALKETSIRVGLSETKLAEMGIRKVVDDLKDCKNIMDFSRMIDRKIVEGKDGKS